MGDTRTDQDQRDEDDTSDGIDDEDDLTNAGGTDTADDESEEDDDAEDDEDDEDAEKAFLAKLDADALKFYNRRKTQLTKARADAGRQRRKLRKVTKTAPPKPTPPVRKSGTSAPVPTKEELLAELRAEFESDQRQAKVLGIAERKLETMISLPSDPDARERKLARVVKMLDLDGAENAADVADAIAELKDDSPEVFRRKRTAKPKTGGVGGPARVAGSGGKPTDKIAGLFDE